MNELEKLTAVSGICLSSPAMLVSCHLGWLPAGPKPLICHPFKLHLSNLVKNHQVISELQSEAPSDLSNNSFPLQFP